MDKQTKQRIIEALELFNFVRYGEHKPCNYSGNDTTANGLQNCINDFNEYNGWLSERVNVMGAPRITHFIDGQTGEKLDKVQSIKFSKATGKIGSSDNHMTIMGKTVKVEVKIRSDRQSKDQKRYERLTTLSGGIYIIAKQFSDYLGPFDTITLGDTREAKIARIREIVLMKAERSRDIYRSHYKKYGGPPNPRDIYHNCLLPVSGWLDGMVSPTQQREINKPLFI